MKKQCKECGSLMHGRSDKKFCSDLCRNAYHNKRTAILNPAVKRINRALQKNRSILALVEQDIIPREELLDEGFNFKYETHRTVLENGTVCHYVYEQGYMLIDAQTIRLIRSKT
jgi:DNA-directed RNA polymerase subunit M/transcription elongation factor TFIIS